MRAATRGSLWTLDRISFKAVQRMGKTLNPLNIEPFNPVTFLDERSVGTVCFYCHASHMSFS